MYLRSRSPLAVTAVFIVIAAAGCSSSSQQSQVAALPTSAASGSSPSTSSSAGTSASSRPRLRLDMTTSQTDALYVSYNQCLAAHGFDKSSKAKRPTLAEYAAAQAACVQLDPLPPWQYDPANPKALGFVQQVVACLHQHGVRYAQVVNGAQAGQQISIALGGPQNDQASITNGLDLIPTCNQQVLRENVSSTSP